MSKVTSNYVNGDPISEDVKEEVEVEEKVGFIKLFSFATKFDVVLIVWGILNAVCTGISLPVFTLFFKDLIDDGFGGNMEGLTADAIRDTSFKFLYISIAMFVCGTISNGALLLAAANQGAAIRKAYVRSILRQDIAWFDTHKSGELTTSLERDCANIQQAIGEKVTLAVHHGVTFVAGIILGFQQGWMMALVLMAALPFVAGSGAWMAKSLQTMQEGAEKSYREAGGIAEQAISGIRTVASLRAESREIERYKSSLEGALRSGVKKGWANGLGFGMVMGAFMGTYALGLWFGSWLIVNRKENDATGEVYTGGEVILVFFCIIMGSFGVGQMGPAIQAFGTGRASAKRVFNIIDRVPAINVDSPDGLKPASVKGDISLQNVAFAYPSRKDDAVFTNLNLDIAAGQTVALVGSSGSGKSTVVQLILRFYDPAGGTVRIDGVDVRELNVKWLRQQIKLVSQEPVLFAVSILENVRYGKDDATEEEVREACRASNAHRFISGLPDKYQTQCGERGRQMSGGEKQRIAIARAIINNPRILLLDEATSALDAESEKLVQSALETLVSGRTTVVVAHRLSTIRSADNIIVFRAGQIAEQGRHDQLIAQHGAYQELVAQQMQAGQGPTQEASGAEGVNEREGVGATEGGGPTRLASDGSKKAEEEEEGERKEAAKEEGKGLFMRALRINRPEWAYIPPALLGSAMNGALFPVLALLLVEMLAAYFQCVEDLSPRGITEAMTFYPDPSDCTSACRWSNVTDAWLSAPCDWNNIQEDVCVEYIPLGDPDAVLALRYYAAADVCFDDMQKTVTKYSLGFVGLAAGAFVAHILQIYSLSFMAEHLTRRLREITFAAVLRQEIGFFDYKENETGVITNKLAKETTYIEGAVGTTIGLAIQNLVLLAISLVIAFIRGWMLTLICFATFPLMVAGQYLQIQFIQGAGGESNKAYALASGVANEAVTSIRTVAAFAAEDKVSQLYHSAITLDGRGVRNTAFVAGMGQGFSLFTIFFLYFCGFAGGAHLMQHHGYTFDDVLQVFFSVTFMGMGAGQAGALAPDIAKAKPAMLAIFKLIDRVPAINAESEDGDKTTRIQGSIELKDVVFRYPTRKINIFSGINIAIQPGQTVALVGASGSGKSTVIALIERFYDPVSGQVLIDGQDVRAFNLKHLRSQLSLVSQEPVLFATSIKENIRYGRENATEEEIIAAATQANAMEFIAQSPDGLERMCGDKGGELSGGQKQRIAIARAMVSNPRILLLDEATSALDATSEKLVQSALEGLMQDRTTVVVAHRLSTIRSADNIIVFRAGAVVEKGSHEELLQIGPEGYYATLIANQMGH